MIEPDHRLFAYLTDDVSFDDLPDRHGGNNRGQNRQHERDQSEAAQQPGAGRGRRPRLRPMSRSGVRDFRTHHEAITNLRHGATTFLSVISPAAARVRSRLS